MTSSEAQTAPLQARSRATRDRILAALAKLLQSKTFDQISVAELIAAADCSMSSFYARFPTKESLLSAFYDRFFEVSAAQMSSALAAIESGKAAPAERMRMLVQFMLRSYRGNRGLLRSLILHDRTHPESGFATRTRGYKQQVFETFLAAMRDERGRQIGPRGRLSGRFRLWLVVQAIEQIVLFDDPVMGSKPISERELTEQLIAVLSGATELRKSPNRRQTAQ